MNTSQERKRQAQARRVARKKSRAKVAQRQLERKARYRVSNWKEYNASLIARGSLTVWISPDVQTTWRYAGPYKQGAPVEYSDTAVTTLLTLRHVFHLPLRATLGFAQSVFRLLQLDLPLPNISTLSRRARTLQIALPKRQAPPQVVVIDASGLKVYGEGEWKVRQHGYAHRRTWRKLHLALDPTTHEWQAVELTAATVTDASAVEPLLAQLPKGVKQALGDGSYDKRKVYQALAAHSPGLQVTIPPRRDAQIWQHGNCAAPPLARDENLRAIRALGRRGWKAQSGYWQRVLAETAIGRFKTIFGPGLASRTLANQVSEARLKASALNRITQLGMPKSYRVH